MANVGLYEFQAGVNSPHDAAANLPGRAVTIFSDLVGDRLIAVSAAFEGFLGYRCDEVIGRTTTELGLWARPHEYSEILKQLRASGKIRNFRAHFRTKSGDIAIGLISVDMIEIDHRAYVIGTTLDITEREHWKRPCQHKRRDFERQSGKVACSSNSRLFVTR